MREVRWLPRALTILADREVDRDEADTTLSNPEFVAAGQPGRTIYMRRYFDAPLGREMLLRVIVDESAEEILVVTLYKTSQLDEYLKGLAR
jgi:hypothetical protein